jgi:hypothetical protein
MSRAGEKQHAVVDLEGVMMGCGLTWEEACDHLYILTFKY